MSSGSEDDDSPIAAKQPGKEAPKLNLSSTKGHGTDSEDEAPRANDKAVEGVQSGAGGGAGGSSDDEEGALDAGDLNGPGEGGGEGGAESDSNAGEESIISAVEPETSVISMTEEELKVFRDQTHASMTLQRVMRGHFSRRAASYSPVWCAYPLPVGSNGWSYALPLGSRPSAAADEDAHGQQERLEMLAAVLEEGLFALPDEARPTPGHPFGSPRPRKELARELVVWCCETAIRCVETSLALLNRHHVRGNAKGSRSCARRLPSQ